MNGPLLSVLVFIQISLASLLPRQSAFPDIPTRTISTNYNNTASLFRLSNGTKTHSRPPTTTPFTIYPSNFTGLGINPSSNSPICLFVVQDSVKMKYWANYHTWLWPEVFNVTSFVTIITKYVDTTVTNYDTKITASTSTTTSIFDIATNKLVADNFAPGPTRIINELNGTALTSMGITFTSPAPFYEYSTVKIISAPAITQMNGQIACVTAMSTYFSFWDYNGLDCTTVSVTFSSINSLAQRYFDKSAVLHPDLWLWAPAKDLPSIESFSVLHQLTLPTTFFHFPAWGVPTLEDNLGFSNSIETLSHASFFVDQRWTTKADHGSPEFEDFGYVPQALVNYITQQPDITSRFPSRASFIPGGPSILERPPVCFFPVAPAFLRSVSDMTFHGESTIINVGCFHPGACIHQDSATVTTTPIAPVQTKRTPEPSATLAGAIATETTFVFSTSSNFKENTPNPSSVEAPARLGELIASAFGLPIKKTNEENSDRPPTIAKSSIVEPLALGSQFQVVGGETNVPDPSHVVIISGKTYSVAPLVSRIGTDTVASALSAYETPRPIPSIVRVGIQELPADDASESDLDGPTLSPSANRVSTLLVNDITSEATALAVSGVQLIPGAEPIIISGVTYSLAPKATTLTVDGQTRILLSGADDDGTNPAGYAVDGTPLVPGAKPITVSGTTYSLTPEATALAVNGVMLIPGSKPVVASGLTYSLAPKATALSINGETRILSSGAQDSTNTAAYAVDGKPLVPGAKPIIVSGTTYSLAPEATALAVNGVMLIPGSKPVVASGLTYSLAPKATALSINGETRILSSGAQNSTNPPAYAVDGKPLVPGAKPIIVSGTTYSLTPEATALAVNGVMLIPGSKPVVASGLTYSLAPKATALSINGETRILSSGAQDSTNSPAYAVDGKPLVPGAKAITVSGITYSLAPKATALTVNDNILIPGGEPVVASGISYSLAPQATAIVINGVIKPLAQGGPYGSEIPRLTGYVIGNQTVVPGAPAITISGSSFSLTPKGNFLLVDNNTAIALPTPAPKPGGQISFYLHSNQIVTASAMLISDSQTSLVMQNINDGYTTATSIKRDSFTVSATEALNRSSSSINTAILSSSAFTSAAANRRERLLSLGGGPLMISLLAGCMFSRIFGFN